jgi:putative endonuclease
MPKVFTSKSQKIGELGEDIACKYLTKHEYTISERNYTKKWGEIDIVAQKGQKIYFVEVKSQNQVGVTHETIRPEENMHPKKLQRLSRTIQTYVLEKRVGKLIGNLILLSECGVTANILVLGTSDSGFESLHSDPYLKLV